MAKLSRYKKVVVAAGIVLALVVVVRSFRQSNASPTNSSTQAVEKLVIAEPLAQSSIDQLFEFPLLDSDNQEVSKIKYYVESVDLRDEIIVKGQRARAIEGRQFLVVSLKITNDFDQGIEINSRDYMRLMSSGDAEKQAPSIHNDPVEVQAISTKETRLGFSVNSEQKSFILQVGEIQGDKQDIQVNF